MSETSTKHYTDLDGMRGILACLVMLMHFGSDRIISLMTGGLIDRCQLDLSVDFFFVLSGFVLARSFRLRHPSPYMYLVKRLLRLAPMFLLSVLAIVAAGVSFDIPTLIFNLLMSQSLLGYDSLNYPSWSIPLELFFPMLALPMVSRWRDLSQASLLLVAFGFVFAGMVCAYTLTVGFDHRLLRGLAGLGLGCATYNWFAPKLAPRTPSIVVVTAFTAIVAVMMIAHRYPLFSLTFHPLVAVTVILGASANSAFSARLCQALGRWSYSIYLLHIPVLMISDKLLGADTVGHNPAFKLLLATATVGIAGAGYRFIEAPFLSWKRATKTTDTHKQADLVSRQAMLSRTNRP